MRGLVYKPDNLGIWDWRSPLIWRVCASGRFSDAVESSTELSPRLHDSAEEPLLAVFAEPSW